MDTNPISSATVATAESTPRLLSFRTLMWGSFAEARRRPGLVGSILLAFAAIMLVGIAMFAVFSFGAVAVGFTDEFNVMTVLAPIILFVAFVAFWIVPWMALGTGLLYCALRRHDRVSVWRGIWWSLQNIWPLIVIGLLVQFSTMTGYFFLIIPGIVLTIYTLFSLPVFMTEGTRGVTALLRSVHIVHGRFWGITWRLCALGFSLIIILCVPIVLVLALEYLSGFVISPLIVLYGIVAYPFGIVWMMFGFAKIFESAVSLAPVEAFNPQERRGLRNLLIVMAVLGFPLYVGVNLVSLLL